MLQDLFVGCCLGEPADNADVVNVIDSTTERLDAQPASQVINFLGTRDLRSEARPRTVEKVQDASHKATDAASAVWASHPLEHLGMDWVSEESATSCSNSDASGDVAEAPSRSRILADASIFSNFSRGLRAAIGNRSDDRGMQAKAEWEEKVKAELAEKERKARAAMQHEREQDDERSKALEAIRMGR
eukprot:TRINITY_DN52426_c0_g1_i1.p2 TRINITY_DN52426_c0_g1~~TRINITY_DN52426_c0_g1_i1.p2  ORF type:complete len:188 (-),score=37.60 TRINITY_DN52426_c0_g1_i1:38-601(-)